MKSFGDSQMTEQSGFVTFWQYFDATQVCLDRNFSSQKQIFWKLKRKVF